MSETISLITGQCHCGAVEYESDGSIFRQGKCTCRACQRATSTLDSPNIGFIDTMILSPEAYNSRKKEEPFDLIDQLGKIKTSALIIRGEVEYPGVMKGADVLRRSIEGAKLYVISKSGHWLIIEAPQSFFGENLAFYKNLNTN